MKWLMRTGLAMMLVLFSFLGVSKAEADPCLPIACATVTLPGTTITLPNATVTSTVPVTVTKTVKVPGPVTTQYVSQPRETVYRTPIGQTVTRRATVTETNTQTVTAPPSTVTKTATATATATVTKTAVVTRTVHEKGVITVKRAKAVGISLGLLLLGGFLALVALWVTYAVGYKDSELEEEKMAEETLSQDMK